MSELLAIDPSIRSAGAAWFTDRTLRAAGRIQSPDVSSSVIGVRCLLVCNAIHAWFTARCGGLSHVELAFEWPQIYRASKSKGDPNDLIGIAGVGSALAGVFAARTQLAALTTPTPDEWIGQLPKVCPACHGRRSKLCKACHGSAWETPRGRRIKSRLSAAELVLVPDQHDAIDAVGIGLHACGRLEVHRVFAGAV